MPKSNPKQPRCVESGNWAYTPAGQGKTVIEGKFGNAQDAFAAAQVLKRAHIIDTSNGDYMSGKSVVHITSEQGINAFEGLAKRNYPKIHQQLERSRPPQAEATPVPVSGTRETQQAPEWGSFVESTRNGITTRSWVECAPKQTPPERKRRPDEPGEGQLGIPGIGENIPPRSR